MFGINLSFAVKRWPEPDQWCRIVKERLGLDQVQLTFDLLDPNWPEDVRRAKAVEVRQAATNWGIEVDSAFVGLAAYTYNGLLDPDPALRREALNWWRRAIEVAQDTGARAVGGPLGGMSARDAADPVRQQQLVSEVTGAVADLAQVASDAGLRELLIEPTPLEREYPHTVDEAQSLLSALAGRTAIPVRYVIDVGHALYQPLYGAGATVEDWIAPLGDAVGLIHLQNTDFQSDSHWGWPDPRGRLDVIDLLRRLDRAGAADVPIALEVMYPFELDDEAVLDNITTSVAHCREALAAARLG